MRKKVIALGLTAIMLVSAIMVDPVNAEAKAKKATLNKSSISLEVGSSSTLKVKNNKKKVTWSTSNKKIAKVTNKGRVTAIKKGTCKVYARVSGKKLTCRVYVYSKEVNTTPTTENTSSKQNTDKKQNTTTKSTNPGKKQNTTTESNNKKNNTTTSTTEAVKKDDCETLGHDTEVITTNATCETAGSKTTKCKRCGKVISTESTPALGHNWAGSYKTHDQSNCKLSGSTGINFCLRCSKMETFTYDVVGHTPITVDEVHGDCTNKGKRSVVCKDCGLGISSQEYGGEGHKWVTDKRVDWTCTTDGLVEQHCSVCGEKHTYVPDKPSIVSHSGSIVTKYEEFDLSEIGYPERGTKWCLVSRCTDCGEVCSVTVISGQ